MTYPLGILLVHGIGTQPAGETITRWGDALVKHIGPATRGTVAATVARAGTGLGDRESDRIEALVKLEHQGAQEQWLVAEGWWADAFLAPSYRELVSWSVRALPCVTANPSVCDRTLTCVQPRNRSGGNWM